MRKNIFAIGILLYTLCLTGCQGNNDIDASMLTNTSVPTEAEMPSPTEVITSEPTATSTPVPTVTIEPTPALTVIPTPMTTTEKEDCAVPELSVTEVPEVAMTSTPTPTVTNTPIPTPTNTPIPTPTNTPIPTPVVEYTVFEYDYGTFYVTRDIKAYDTPHGMGKMLGVVNKGTQIFISGKCPKTGWYQISYNNKDAFISGGYITKDKSNIKEFSLGSNEVIVPDITGLSFEEAIELLTQHGLKVSDMSFGVEGTAYNMEQVCTSNPAPGDVAKKNSTVYLYFSFDFSMYDTTVYESLADTKIIRRTLIEKTNGGVAKDFDEYNQYSAFYEKVEELEYEDGTILRVSFQMKDSGIKEVNWVHKIREASTSPKASPVLNKDCIERLNVGNVSATYSLDSSTVYSGWGTGNCPSSFENEYLVEFTDKGYHIVMSYSPRTGSKLVFTDSVENLGGYKNWDPLFWAQEEATVIDSADGSFVEITYADNSGYTVYYTVKTEYYGGKQEYKVIDYVTFYNENRQETDTIYLHCEMPKDFYVWYRYVGDGVIRLINADGTPVEKYKDVTFYDKTKNPITGQYEKIFYSSGNSQVLKTKQHEYHLDETVFKILTTDDKVITFYQKDFPIEDY